LYEYLDDPARAALPAAALDAVIVQAMALLVNVKFITLFSLLFGLGFALQLERAQASGADGLRRYARRLLVLALFGMVHSYFIWWGDILLTYAVVGLLMLPFRRVPDWVLLVAGIAFALMPPLLSPWVREILPAMPRHAAVYAEGLDAFSSGSWSRVLHANVDLANWARVSNWALVCFVLGRFLLGYWAGRRGLLQAPERHLPMLRRILGGSLGLGIAMMVLSSLQVPMRETWPIFDGDIAKLLIRMLVRIGPLALGIAYAAAFALVFCKPNWRSRLALFAPVGRMALTHYLAQSVIGMLLFYGIGLDIGPRFGMVGVLLAWGLIFGAQVWMSRLWLERFRYGPVEWLWRWMTCGSRPPLRVASLPA
jgi:uncharacterized protein